MAIDDKDLKCTEAEKNAISAVLAGVVGFDANVVPWKQLGNEFYFIPEAICGGDAHAAVPDAVLLLVKHVLAHP